MASLFLILQQYTNSHVKNYYDIGCEYQYEIYSPVLGLD